MPSQSKHDGPDIPRPVTVKVRQLDMSGLDRTLMRQAAVEDALDGVNLAISYEPGPRVEAHLEVARTAILDAQSVLAEGRAS